MSCIRPATPGFIVTLAATVLLGLVSFCVPLIKSIFFLRAAITVDGFSGSVIFGTLGYCIELSDGTTCSKPSIGYQLDINALVGDTSAIQIPQVAVKWITYALVLHIVAFAAAGGSAIFGLLAHVREMSMTCCSSFISGFAAVVAMLAFAVDLILFFVAKSKINAVGSAQIGSAIWLTLAAWVLLFLSGCFYSFGRCCISNRSNNKGYDDNNGRDNWISGGDMGKNDYNEQRRLDAVKAEADRKAFQRNIEGGLPEFPETQPLTGTVYGDQVHLDEHPEGPQPSVLSSIGTIGRQQSYSIGGYVQGAAGTRAMDDYYGTSSLNTYPPQPQASSYSPSIHASTNSVPQSPPQHPLPLGAGYGPSSYGYNSTPPVQMHALPNQSAQEPFGNAGPSYLTASGLDQQTSSYSQYNAPTGDIKSQSHLVELSYNPHPDPYGAGSLLDPPIPAATNTSSLLNPPIPFATDYATRFTPNPYLIPPTSPPPQQSLQPERSYTLGGDSSQFPVQEHNTSGYYEYNEGPSRQPLSSPPPISTNVGYTQDGLRSPVAGPRAQPVAAPASHEDLPPVYDSGTHGITGNWGKGQQQ